LELVPSLQTQINYKSMHFNATQDSFDTASDPKFSFPEEYGVAGWFKWVPPAT